jgi:hypothetical protein
MAPSVSEPILNLHFPAAEQLELPTNQRLFAVAFLSRASMRKYTGTQTAKEKPTIAKIIMLLYLLPN